MSVQSELALEHYAAMGNLSLLMQRELEQVWRQIDGATSAVQIAALLEAVPGLGEVYGDMAATLAADFFEMSREIADVPGKFTATMVELPELDRFGKLVEWATQPLLVPEPQPGTVLSRVQGGLQRIVTDVSRETIVQNTERDPKATGWKRIARSDGCSFCKMLARGTYKDVGARFASHDHCGCTASPSWDRSTEVSVLAYTASERVRTPEEKAQLRAYLKRNFK